MGPKDCKVIKPQDLEMFASPNATRQWYAAERYTIGVAVHPPGAGHARHVHEDAEEMLYIVSGSAILRFYYPDSDRYEEAEAGPGDLVYVPPKVEHSGDVIGWEPWKVVVIYAPPGDEQYVMKGEYIVPRGERPDMRFRFQEGKYVIKE